MTLLCCHVACEDEAEFEIVDLAERRPDGGTTYSCESHVGSLLGHATDLEAPVNVWSVAARTPEDARRIAGPLAETPDGDIHDYGDHPDYPAREAVSADTPEDAVARAAKWPTFVLLRTVIEQTTSSLRTEALLKLDELEARVRDAEALGDA